MKKIGTLRRMTMPAWPRNTEHLAPGLYNVTVAGVVPRKHSRAGNVVLIRYAFVL